MFLRTLSIAALFFFSPHSTATVSELATSNGPTVGNPEGSARLIEVVTEAKRIVTIKPKFPKQEARLGREGWVQLSYVVGADGKTHGVSVIDSSGSKNFEREAIRSVKKWVFEPAKMNGEPIEQCDTSVQMDFRIGGEEKVTHGGWKLINKALALLEKQDYDRLSSYVTKFKRLEVGKMMELAYYNYISAEYYRAIGDRTSEYHALKQTLSYTYEKGDFKYLPKARTLLLMGRVFEMHIGDSKYANALEMFDNIAAEEHEIASQLVDIYQPYVEKVNRRIASTATIKVLGNLKASDTWNHQLVRNAFSIRDIKGDLNKVDIRCKNKRYTYTANGDSVWTIPKKWGQCQLIVSGEKGTEFSLLEVNDKKANSVSQAAPAA